MALILAAETQSYVRKCCAYLTPVAVGFRWLILLFAFRDSSCTGSPLIWKLGEYKECHGICENLKKKCKLGQNIVNG